MTAQEIVHTIVSGWGERSSYPIHEDEFVILAKAGGTVDVLNQNNGDGTFFSSLTFDGKEFSCSSSVLVQPAGDSK